MEPLLQQLLEKYPKDLKLVVKHFPIQSHKRAGKAALAAMAAKNQDKFWEFHSKIFENFRSLSDDKLLEIATGLNLDMDKFKADQDTPAVKNIILRDLQNGRQAGVRGTPTLFVNGILVKNRSLQGLSLMVEKELKKNRSR